MRAATQQDAAVILKTSYIAALGSLSGIVTFKSAIAKAMLSCHQPVNDAVTALG